MPTFDPNEELNRKIDRLVAAAKAGDIDAFEVLFADCRKKLFVRALSITKNVETAQDLVQDTFLKAWNSISLYSRKSFCGWLKTIAVRLWIDWIRKNRREVPFDAWIYEVLADETTDPESRALKTDFHEALLACIAELPADLQTMLRYSYGQDLGLREIAELVFPGEPESAKYKVDKRITAAKKLLLKCLRRKRYSPPEV